MVDLLHLVCFTGIFILVNPLKVVYGEWCSKDYGTEFEYCHQGCCGHGYNQHCCLSIIPLIVGGVVGGILFIIIIVALICVCYQMQKRKHRVGTVLSQPTTTYHQSSVHVIQPNQSWPNQQWPIQPPAYPGTPGYAYGPPPGSDPPPPPSYKPPDPAFPPTSSAFSGHNPNNFGMSGNQRDTPSAPPGNQQTSGL